jgi:DNA polymerase
MLVGEVPGDQEDRVGHVFVGPAGRELDRALAAAGIARGDVYVTNAVKHFKFEERGKRRIHQKPSRWEVRACNPWLRAELEAVSPRALVILGATAGQALIGPSFKLGEARGGPIDSDLAERVTATSHPSAILRVRSREAREAMRAQLEGALRDIVEFLAC